VSVDEPFKSRRAHHNAWWVLRRNPLGVPCGGMPPTETLREIEQLQRVAQRSPDHRRAVSFVKSTCDDARQGQNLAAISCAVSFCVAAILRNRIPEASVLAGIVGSVAGMIALYNVLSTFCVRRHLSGVHAARIHMIMDQIREVSATYRGAADEAEHTLIPLKRQQKIKNS